MWTMNFHMFKLDLEKSEGPEIKLPTSFGSLKNQEFQRNISFCFIDYAKAFDCVDHNKLWKILKEMDTWSASLETCMQVRKQQLELDMEQQTPNMVPNNMVPNRKRSTSRLYCHPAYLTYMQSTSWETLGWVKHKLESRLPGDISITSDMQMTPTLMAESEEELKSLLMKVKDAAFKLLGVACGI